MSVQELAEAQAPQASDHNYVEVPCQRSVSGGNFSSGVQDFVFTIGRPSCWYPSTSYFKIELEVLGGGVPANALQPKLSEQIALAENCVSNAYQNAYFTAGGQMVSGISNYLAQASAVAFRTEQTKSYVDSVGQSSFGKMASFSERVAAISSNGVAGSAPTRVDATVGLSGLDDEREETYKPILALAQPSTFYTVSIAAAAGVADSICTFAAGSTNFTDADVGATLVVNGQKYVITTRTSAVLVNVAGIINPVVATADWYCIRRNLTRSTQARNKQTILWRPPLGVFGLGGDVSFGSGDYRFQLSPSADFRTSMVECYNPNYANNSGANCPFTLNINDIKFYAHIAKASIPDGVQECFFNEWQLQSKTQTSLNMTHSFTVPPSTRSLYVFLQSGSAGTNPAFPPSKLASDADSDLNCTSIQITYANLTKPQTRWVSGFANDPTSPATNGRNVDLLTQLYHQQLLESGLESAGGGCETENEWLRRGPLYGFRFDRDMTDRSTEVQLQITYSNPSASPFDTTSKLFLCANYSKQVNVRTQNGQVVEVQSLAI